jgi:hypothetical protein
MFIVHPRDRVYLLECTPVLVSRVANAIIFLLIEVGTRCKRAPDSESGTLMLFFNLFTSNLSLLRLFGQTLESAAGEAASNYSDNDDCFS